MLLGKSSGGRLGKSSSIVFIFKFPFFSTPNSKCSVFMELVFVIISYLKILPSAQLRKDSFPSFPFHLLFAYSKPSHTITTTNSSRSAPHLGSFSACNLAKFLTIPFNESDTSFHYSLYIVTQQAILIRGGGSVNFGFSISSFNLLPSPFFFNSA